VRGDAWRPERRIKATQPLKKSHFGKPEDLLWAVAQAVGQGAVCAMGGDAFGRTAGELLGTRRSFWREVSR
jgi:hypothetical protein